MQQAFRNMLQAGTFYVEGQSLIGDSQEFTLPNIEMIMQDVRNHGMVGNVKRFTGVETPEVQVITNAYLADVLTQVGPPNIREKQYQARWSTQSADSEVKYGIAEFAGRGNMIERAAASDGAEGMTTTLTIQCVQYKETYDGEELYDIDVENGIFKIRGVDYWEPIAAGL